MGTHMGMLPVVDNLLHVVEGVEQEVITPFIPVNGHSAIPVHTGRENMVQCHQKCHVWSMTLVSDSNPGAFV